MTQTAGEIEREYSLLTMEITAVTRAVAWLYAIREAARHNDVSNYCGSATWNLRQTARENR